MLKNQISYINFIIQVTGWAVFLGLPFYLHSGNAADTKFLTDYILRHLILILFFYFNYFYLIPVSLKQKGLGIYLLHVILLFGATFLIQNLIEFLTHPERNLIISFKSLIALVQLYAISTTLKMLIDFIIESNKRKILEEEKKQSELAFLRSQINPHFLFNTLNNINSLVRKDPEAAEQTIVKLSNLMRYVLSSSKLQKIRLKEELAYLQNFIDLQKIRLPVNFDLTFETINCNSEIEIEPLLLIGFIENTFKHALSGEESDYIKIKIELRNRELLLITENSIAVSNNKMIDSGIGIQNIRRRLNLLYPHKHELLFNVAEERHSVYLKLIL